MTNKQELNKEELEEVSGGEALNGCAYHLLHYTKKIDKYQTENYIGEKAFMKNPNEDWLVGTIKKSFEKTYKCGTRRVATVYVTDSNYYSVGLDMDVILDGWEIYVRH